MKKYQHISPTAVLRYLKEGYTLKEIGEFYGVTKQRIFQIANTHPAKPVQGWDIKAWRLKRRERNRIS
jgi:hypothetical protein